MAPWTSRRISRSVCLRRNLGGRPEENRTRSASSPPRRRACNQRMTELAPQPMRRAASLSEQPESTKANARRRRSSNKSALPLGLGIGVRRRAEHLHYGIGFRGRLLHYLYVAK